MTLKISFLLLTGVIGLSFFGCSSGGDFRSGAAIGVSRNDKDKDSDSDDEKDQSDEPVEVSGSFLTCAFMDSETAVIEKAKENSKANLDIACGLYRKIGNSFGRVDDSKLKLQTRILNNKGKLVLVPHRRIEGQMQLITTVPVEMLSGTIHVDYYDPSNGTFSSRRKSIPTITEFMAKIGFSVNDDESVGRFVSGQFPTDGRIDPADSIVPENKLDWWALLIPIIVKAFGEQASIPASNDNGATVYRPRDKNKPVVIYDDYPVNNQQSNQVPSNQVPSNPVPNGQTPTKQPETTDKPDAVNEPAADPAATKPIDDNFVPVDIRRDPPAAAETPPKETGNVPDKTSESNQSAVETGGGSDGPSLGNPSSNDTPAAE